jgi:hypothetical protein
MKKTEIDTNTKPSTLNENASAEIEERILSSYPSTFFSVTENPDIVIFDGVVLRRWEFALVESDFKKVNLSLDEAMRNLCSSCERSDSRPRPTVKQRKRILQKRYRKMAKFRARILNVGVDVVYAESWFENKNKDNMSLIELRDQFLWLYRKITDPEFIKSALDQAISK